MTFEAGHPRYGGRKAGQVNKLTASVKEAFAEAFERMGGADALVAWGTVNQTDFYKLASKLIPVDVSLGIQQIPQARAFPLGPPIIENNEQQREIEDANTIN